MAMSAYMPPSTNPARRMSIRRDMMLSAILSFVMPGHSPSKTGVNALMPGHPRLPCRMIRKQDVDGRDKPGHDGWDSEVLLPRRLRHDRRARAILLRRDAVEVVALPLPDRP